MDRLAVLGSHLTGPIGSTASCSAASLSSSIDIAPEVAEALRNGAAVVALESTIISHGMPYPQNVDTARRVEDTVRQYGAVPATIAVLHGRIKVGLSPEDLELLGKTGLSVMKCSRRDMAFCVARKAHGATTVSGTMLVASMVGIEVFVTGGIGGVHRHGESTMDVSADLTELGRTRVTVVSAGVKSILDIPRTMEYLETQGVPVITVGSKEFPAFFTRKSGCMSQLSGSIDDAAALTHQQRQLGINTGIICANPIPEDTEASVSTITQATVDALAAMEREGVSGKDATPYLLDKINKLTGGKSLEANIALVLNNAKVGATLAVKVAALRRSA
eukprot:TRINITY_DN676_c0_g1_i1.p1 TRINITY_DN676_c0_g1~~TRINITY_DN676_c0_g1_i1.p1  ORF type:complete len:344 (+),score=141.86 TRINITY_DN676_c0_g1_i1:35-1033(+)